MKEIRPYPLSDDDCTTRIVVPAHSILKYIGVLEGKFHAWVEMGTGIQGEWEFVIERIPDNSPVPYEKKYLFSTIKDEVMWHFYGRCNDNYRRPYSRPSSSA